MSRSPVHSQKWHSATKRHIMDGWNSNSNTAPATATVMVDGSNPEHVKNLLKGLNSKYDQIVNNLKADAEDCKLQQEQALSVGLVRLPTAVRQMTVKDFNKAHQCDLLALLKSKDGVVLSKRKRDHQDTVAATPAPSRSRNGTAPMTASRTVRKGEGIFSANGSPIEAHEAGTVVATVTKKRRGNGTEGGANFEINVGEGRVINLNDPTGVHDLDSDMKATAATQLKVLQDQMASLIAVLTE